MADNDKPVGSRRRSKIAMYAHLVWATRGRCAFLTPPLEQAAYRCIVAEAEKMRCEVLAIGGMPDHVHLVVRLPGDVGPSQLAKQVKGLSSRLINTLREPFTDHFDWQKGFAAFSLDKTTLPRAVRYVENQREHHARATVWPLWEETDEPAPAPVGGAAGDEEQAPG